MGVLEVHDVSIRYLTGDFKDIGLKEFVMRKATKNYHVQEFWADRNVDFSLERGDMLGIIGVNGAGKSTLLKVISGIMEPTKGWVKREGSIAPLLELASGFDGELTVRENTYLRGALLGYTRKFMDETYDQIIDFAELREFQDRPFKQLSSGMKSRLAFAIASLVEPDILILDEVLSVGDGAFQKKSEAKMRQIIGSGATTILVTHSVSQVRSMCNKVLWLHKGRQVTFGENVDEVCDRYEAFLAGDESQLGEEYFQKMKSDADMSKKPEGPIHPPISVESLVASAPTADNNFFIRAFFLLFAAFMAAASLLIYTNGGSQFWFYYKTLSLWYIGVFALAFLLCHKLAGEKKQRYVLLFGTVAAGVLLRWMTIHFLQVQPTSDIKLLHDFYDYYHQRGPYTEVVPWGERDMYQRYFSRSSAWYFHMRLIMLVYDIFGRQLVNMQIFDLLSAAVTMILIYAVVPNKKVGLMAAMLFAFHPSMILLSALMCPDHVSIPMILLVVWFWRKAEQCRGDWPHSKKAGIYALLAALCCMVANWFKQVAVLFIPAFICYEFALRLYPAIKARVPVKEVAKRVMSYELVFVLAAGCFIAAGNGILNSSMNSMLKTRPINNIGIFLTQAYAVDEDGNYDAAAGSKRMEQLYKEYGNDYDQLEDFLKQEGIRTMKENFSFKLLRQRFFTGFGSEYGYFGFTNTSPTEGYAESVVQILQAPVLTAAMVYMQFLYVLSAIGAVMAVVRKRVDKLSFFSAIIIFGYSMILILGAAAIQGRYKSLVVPLWCIFAGTTLSNVGDIRGLIRGLWRK